jgi:hypothetical protein
MKLNKRASPNAIIKTIMNNANGINTSKIKAKSKSDLLGQNGQKVSIKNHSIKSQQNFRTVLTQYINFIKDNYEGKVLKHINNDTILQFIAYKTNQVQGNTINTYISAFGKISDNLNDLGINFTDRDIITDYRTILKNHNIELHTHNVNRSYEKPLELVNYMREHTLFGLSASLQYFSGLRLDDATNFSKLAINQDNTLKVTGSKGGINYTTKALPKWLINELQQAKEQNIHIDKDEYRKALIDASNGTGQNYTGTHGLRYNFANERVRELKDKSLSQNEAMLKASLEMGHSRISIILNSYYFD